MIFFHGTPSGKLFDGKHGIHVGTFRAATEALEARIGIPAEGKWDGTREYGKTLLAGRKSLESGRYGKYRMSGFNCDAPEEDYFPTSAKKAATYSDQTIIPLNSTPAVLQVNIIKKMSNSIFSPISDSKANSMIKSLLNRNQARSGYYYENIGEDSGSISAVVPNQTWLEII